MHSLQKNSLATIWQEYQAGYQTRSLVNSLTPATAIHVIIQFQVHGRQESSEGSVPPLPQVEQLAPSSPQGLQWQEARRKLQMPSPSPHPPLRTPAPGVPELHDLQTYCSCRLRRETRSTARHLSASKSWPKVFFGILPNFFQTIWASRAGNDTVASDVKAPLRLQASNCTAPAVLNSAAA